jgi:amino acid adenylation domain-containing protein
MDGVDSAPTAILSFLRSAERFPNRPAVDDGEQVTSYTVLKSRAGALAAILASKPPRLVGVLAERSVAAYSAVLGIHWAGKGYVPLNPKFPPARLEKLRHLAGLETVIVGPEGMSKLEEWLDMANPGLTCLLSESDAARLSKRFPRHHFPAILAGTEPPPPAADATAVAYLLFTSGSTGEPKGVPVRQSNLNAYLTAIGRLLAASESDRFSQTFDLSFDLSAHDLFAAWQAGACVCPLPLAQRLAPAEYIRDRSLTMWFSVPSLAAVMRQLRLLRPGAFANLRVSLFCGEALPASLARAWRQAAPQSRLENLYGPTEATIAITHFCWSDHTSPALCRHGIVPIGICLEGASACAMDEKGNPVAAGGEGELCLSGPQVVSGYWNDLPRTRERFFEKDRCIWYRTGDRVQCDESGCFHFLGRFDHQLKVRGFRVELEEIEFRLREASGSAQVACVGWPIREGRVEGICAFVAGSFDEARLRQACRDSLPEYMVPDPIRRLDAFPLNANGKIDRAGLLRILESEDTSDAQ